MHVSLVGKHHTGARPSGIPGKSGIDGTPAEMGVSLPLREVYRLRTRSDGYSVYMATVFTQQSNEYIQQIEAEIERLQQLRNQVRTTIQSEEQLENEELKRQAPRKRAMKKSAGNRAASKKVAAKKRGRPKASEAAA